MSGTEAETLAEAPTEVVEAQAGAAVEIARIEAERDVAVAETHAEAAVAQTEAAAGAASDELREGLQTCLERIDMLAGTLVSLTAQVSSIQATQEALLARPPSSLPGEGASAVPTQDSREPPPPKEPSPPKAAKRPHNWT